MELTSKNPEFIKRIITDDAQFSDIRNKLWSGAEITQAEIEHVISTQPDTTDAHWGKDRLTMLPWSGIQNLHMVIADTLARNIPGDFLEAGVWKGGACILATALYEAAESDTRVFVADSFAGLPKPDAEKYPEDRNDEHYVRDDLRISQETVTEHFSRIFGSLPKRVVFLKGWFKDTLPNAPIEKLSVLRMDGDMYESTMNILENLYPKLSVGGYCIIDDYHHYGCRKAVEDYRKRFEITAHIQKAADSRPHDEIYYWIKEGDLRPAKQRGTHRSIGRKLEIFRNDLVFRTKAVIRKLIA